MVGRGGWEDVARRGGISRDLYRRWHLADDGYCGLDRMRVAEARSETISAHILSYTMSGASYEPWQTLACNTGGLWDYAEPWDAAGFAERVGGYACFLSAYHPLTDHVHWNGPSLGSPHPTFVISSTLHDHHGLYVLRVMSMGMGSSLWEVWMSGWMAVRRARECETGLTYDVCVCVDCLGFSLGSVQQVAGLEFSMGAIFSDVYYRFRSPQQYIIVTDLNGIVLVHPQAPPPEEYVRVLFFCLSSFIVCECHLCRPRFGAGV